jgi:malonyl-CoA O-methyltransferase
VEESECLPLFILDSAGCAMFGKRKKAKPTETRKAYDLWASSYPPEAHNPLMKAEEQAMMALFPVQRGCLCLDLGCGSGRFLKEMEKRGARGLGLDLSHEMLKVAARHMQSPLVAGSMEKLPFPDGIFDSVVCGLAVGHLAELRFFACETARILKPGGFLLYSDFHPFLAIHGLERTFRDPGGELRSVEHHLHLYAHHQQALKEAGLFITDVAEPEGSTSDPALPDPCPLVLVIQAEKR